MDVSPKNRSKIKILHFSKTPLAGAPIRLVQALQRHSSHEIHLIDFDGGFYDHDVLFPEEREKAVALAEEADIIHLHNYLDYDSTCFSPIDFEDLRRKGKAFLRQYHSHPALIAQGAGNTVEEVLSCEIPALVVAQFQERFYPKAKVVPNILPIDLPHYLPNGEEPLWDLFFTPSVTGSAWDDRWNTKGADETSALMQTLAQEMRCSIHVLTGQPLQAVLQEKRRFY